MKVQLHNIKLLDMTRGVISHRHGDIIEVPDWQVDRLVRKGNVRRLAPMLGAAYPPINPPTPPDPPLVKPPGPDPDPDPTAWLPLDTTDYGNLLSIRGSSGATMEFVTDTWTKETPPRDNGVYWQGELVGAADHVDSNLVIGDVKIGFLNGDAGNGKTVLTAKWIPNWEFRTLKPNGVLWVRYEWANEVLSVGPATDDKGVIVNSQYQWTGETGTDAPKDVMIGANTYPVIRQVQRVLVIFGTRVGTVLDENDNPMPPDYSAYENTISSDAFMGYPA